MTVNERTEPLMLPATRALPLIVAAWILCAGSIRAYAAQSTADVLAKARPAVVTVLAFDESGKQCALGSGFVVRADGVIVTAWHVLAGASKVRIKFATGKSYELLSVVAVDEKKDYAVLKIDASNLRALEFGNSEMLRQGDRVYALGSPLGFEQTATDGIVSAIRLMPGIGKLLQVSAAISPGSSGGPVLNARGQVVGIAILKAVAGEDLNFAVTINLVKSMIRGFNEDPQAYLRIRMKSNFDSHYTYAQFRASPISNKNRVFELRGRIDGYIQRERSFQFLLTAEDGASLLLNAPDANRLLVCASGHKLLRVLVRGADKLEVVAMTYDSGVTAHERAAIR